ncbi:ATP-binding protein [Aliikangiella maris]|uniref:histidine kinase n=2 Tax=Aliikangiella maris TaxID=3162458 RepID=A0ABV3MJM6_9GAMM
MQLHPEMWPLKSKFVAILLLALFIPVSTVVLLKEIEKALVDNLKKNLLLSTQFYSLQLANNSEWFYQSRLPKSSDSVAEELFVFPLQQQIIIDGFFADEWQFVEKFRQHYFPLPASSSMNSSGNTTKAKHDNQMSVLLGDYEESLYVSIQVLDKNVVYPELNQQTRSDQLVVSFIDQNEQRYNYYILPKAPGKIPVYQYSSQQLRIDWRFTAYWVETADGFNVEIKFPAGIKPVQLGVKYYDIDKLNDQLSQQVIATSPIELNPIVWPSKSLSEFVQHIETIPGQRIWVLDVEGRVLARRGNLDSILSGQTNSFTAWLLHYLADEVIDTRANQVRLNSLAIFRALQGVAYSYIETKPNNDFSVALAASPIKVNGEILGVVLLEENIARVQLLQQQTLTRIINAMLIIIVLIMGIIGWYVTRLVRRITRLKNTMNSVVDEHGRLSNSTPLELKQGDEIDELNNAFVHMNNKIFDYNAYLEKLASRLSHELRTPIAIVRSSLDNLMLTEQSDENLLTIQRALNGIQRLADIISRMRQASSVKSAMQSAEFEKIELNDYLQQIVSGFQATFQHQQFQFKSNISQHVWQLSPDLFAELMDKLLSNAMDFAHKNTPITVSLSESDKQVEVAVTNLGPIVEKKNRNRIFQSLVSIRETSATNQFNLGLGLYVVKLIAEFHQAKVVVENLPDKSGVIFKVIWQKF